MLGDSSARSSLDVPRLSNLPISPRCASKDVDPLRCSPDNKRGRAVVSGHCCSSDPRSSSTQSLRPIESSRDGRRTLLLIYIHGFMGNETSFQSFPAHVHNLLNILVADSHVVHTKLYPRYKSRKAIEFARDDFSEWLEPNEATSTDVVLLGHSMGGILSAEVALLLPRSRATTGAFRHHILGTISFDTPYLGIHPGVIISGIGSLFRTVPSPPTCNQDSQIDASAESSQISQTSSHETYLSASPPLDYSQYPTDSMSSLSLTQNTSAMSTIPSNDPNYNPPFPNDKHLAERKGWSSVLYFINKHSDNLTSAAKQYFISHLEFGGCLADYPGLMTRYSKIRALEDLDKNAERSGSEQTPQRTRVRYVNYWTASTGYPKREIPDPDPIIDKHGHLKPTEVNLGCVSLSDSSSRPVTPIPSISMEEYVDEGFSENHVHTDPLASAVESWTPKTDENPGVHKAEVVPPPEIQHVDPIPFDENKELIDQVDCVPGVGSEPSLPPIPPVPKEPQLIDLGIYTDKDARKIAEKEQKRTMKAYQRALKDREDAIKDRQKLVEKREKKVRQAQGKLAKSRQRQRLKDEKEAEERQTTVNRLPEMDPKTTKGKVRRDKKFCMMPPKINGREDECWVRVHMEGVDEVGAHCRLFFPGPQYEGLVGDVASRIESWVKENTKGERAVLENELDDHRH